jgi:hypothetical protein
MVHDKNKMKLNTYHLDPSLNQKCKATPSWILIPHQRPHSPSYKQRTTMHNQTHHTQKQQESHRQQIEKGRKRNERKEEHRNGTEKTNSEREQTEQ